MHHDEERDARAPAEGARSEVASPPPEPAPDLKLVVGYLRQRDARRSRVIIRRPE